MKEESLALALSGGGNRGAIHVGVLYAFEQNNIKISAISGTSAGAIIGALFASGISALQLKDIILSQSIGTMLHFTLKKSGLANMKGLRKVLEDYITDNSYSSLNIPLYVCASNIDDSDFEIFSSGDLFTHVCASSSVPILFEPVIIDGKHYVDGGLFNNLPVEPLINKYDSVIGVHVNNYKIKQDYSIKTIANQIFSMVIKQNVKRNMKQCDYLINPELEQPYRRYSKKTTEQLFEIGYQAGIEFLLEHKCVI